MDLPKNEQFDVFPSNVIEREFEVKVGIDSGAKTMAAWKKQYPNIDEEFSVFENISRNDWFLKTRNGTS